MCVCLEVCSRTMCVRREGGALCVFMQVEMRVGWRAAGHAGGGEGAVSARPHRPGAGKNAGIDCWGKGERDRPQSEGAGSCVRGMFGAV